MAAGSVYNSVNAAVVSAGMDVAQPSTVKDMARKNHDDAQALGKITKEAADDQNSLSIKKWPQNVYNKLKPNVGKFFAFVITGIFSPVIFLVALGNDACKQISIFCRKIAKVDEPLHNLMLKTAEHVEGSKKLSQQCEALDSQNAELSDQLAAWKVHAGELKGLNDQFAHQVQQQDQQLNRVQYWNNQVDEQLAYEQQRAIDLEQQDARSRVDYQAVKGGLEKQLAEKSLRIDQLSKELEAARQQHDHTKEENICTRQKQAERIQLLESQLSAEQKQKRELVARHQGNMQALNDKEVTIRELLQKISGLRKLTEAKDREHNNKLNTLTNDISAQRDQIRLHERQEQQLRSEISHLQDLAKSQDQDNNNNAVHALHAPMSDQTGRTMSYEMTEIDRNLTAELHHLLITHQVLPADQPGVINHQHLVQQADKVLQQKTLLLGEETERRTKAEADLEKLLQHYRSEVDKFQRTISELEQQFRQAQDDHAKQSDELAMSRSQQVLAFQQALEALENEQQKLLLRISQLEEESQETESQKHDLQQRLQEYQKLSDRLKVTNQDLYEKNEVISQKNQRLREELDRLAEEFRQLPALGKECPGSEDDDPETAERESNVHQLQATLEDRLKSEVEVLEARVAQVQEELEVKNTKVTKLKQRCRKQTVKCQQLESRFKKLDEKRREEANLEKFAQTALQNDIQTLQQKLAEMSSSAKKVSRDVQTSEVSVTGPRELVDMASQADVEFQEVTSTTQAQLKEVIRSNSEHHSIDSPSSPEKVSLALQATPEDELVEPRELVHMASNACVEPNEEVNALKQELLLTQVQLIQFAKSAREFQPVYPETIELSSYGSSSKEEGSFEGGMSMLAPGVDRSLVVGSYHQELGHRTFNDPGEVRFKDLCTEKEALKKRLEGMEQHLVQLVMEKDDLTEENGGLLEQVHKMQSDLQGFDSLKRGFNEASEQRDEALINYEAQKIVIENQDLRIKELQTEVTHLEETSELELTDFKTKLTALDEKNKEFAQKQQKLLADRSRLENEKFELQSNLIQAMTCSNTSNVNQGADQEKIRLMKLEKEELDKQVSFLGRELEMVSQELRDLGKYHTLELKSKFDSLVVEIKGEEGTEDDFFTEQEGSDVAEQVKQLVRTKFGEYKDENEKLRNTNRQLAINLAAQKLAEDAIVGALSSLDSKK